MAVANMLVRVKMPLIVYVEHDPESGDWTVPQESGRSRTHFSHYGNFDDALAEAVRACTRVGGQMVVSVDQDRTGHVRATLIMDPPQ